MSREAALQGVPSIIVSEIGHTYVNKYLAKKGFPLFFAGTSNVLSCAKRYLGKRFDVRSKLADLENPLDIIEQLTTKDNFGNPI
jgi:predicted glycosyltransferase